MSSLFLHVVQKNEIGLGLIKEIQNYNTIYNINRILITYISLCFIISIYLCTRYNVRLICMNIAKFIWIFLKNSIITF